MTLLRSSTSARTPAGSPTSATGASGTSGGLFLILAVAFMVVLDFSIVNVALAAIERELHANASAVQWVITAYAITFGGLLVLGGRLGDIWGRRRLFVIGLLIFALASLAGGLAPNLAVLVAARALQGLGAAIVAPAALALITTTVPEGSARTKALGLYGATASVGFAAGLVFGGILVQFLDWRAVLWVNVPIGLIAAFLTPVLIPAPIGSTRGRRLDVLGALLVTGSVAAAVYGISDGPAHGWLSGSTVVPLLFSVVLAGGFVLVERRHPSPLVRLGIFRIRNLRSANAYVVMLGGWSAGVLLVMPLYLQLLLHYSALATGMALAPQGIAGFLGSMQGHRVIRRFGLRTLLITSGVAAGVGLALLGLALSTHSYLLILVGLVLAGYGTSTGAFGSTVAATAGVPDGEQGLAGGLINMSRQVGAALGVALVAAVIGSAGNSGGSISADRIAVLLTAAAAAVAVLVAVRGIGTPSATSAKVSSGGVEIRHATRKVAPLSSPQRVPEPERACA